jgi:septum formation topological specificity factor MinE
MKNIHILPTDKPSRLFIDIDDNKLKICVPLGGEHMMNQHIYITSDEEIKHGDWCLSTDKNFIIKLVNLPAFSCDRKIIITDNQDLIKDGVQAIDDEFLEWIVKNSSCERVEVNYDVFEKTGNISVWEYDIIIPQEEPKPLPDVNWESDIINKVWDEEDPKQ